MIGWKRRGSGIWAVGLALVLGYAALLHPQLAGDGGGIRTTTSERMETETWWPTMTTAPLNAYAGTRSCEGCHAQEVATTPPSSMQRAAEVLSGPDFLKAKQAATFKETPYTYSLSATATGIEYAVTDGSHKVERKLDWVIGAGELGRTFVYEDEGRWFQSEASFYTASGGLLDETTGLSQKMGTTLETALGQELSAADARSCFGCHTVHPTTANGFNPSHAEAGLGCEACHGPAKAHVSLAGLKASGSVAHATGGVFNPAKLSPADSIDFCGACHRASADVAGMPTSTAMVRFQPYRLEESKCWRATQDAKLTCVACHDPHAPVVREAATYDKHCLACHSAGVASEHAGKVCPRSPNQCVTCHMPKVNIASMHGDFTDHFIRVVKAGEGFPR